MKDEKNDLSVILLFLEITAVLLLCLVILSRMDNRGKIEPEVITVTATPTMSPTPTPTQVPTNTPTPTCTPVPTNTPTPTPWPSVTKKAEKGHTFKPYTRYTAYNVADSMQRRLQIAAMTDETTGIRIVTDHEHTHRYCIALGTYWAGGQPEHIGRYIDVVMENGAVLKCVLADVKKQEHTKGGANRYGSNNELLEFIVDEKFLSDAVKICGNVSKAGAEFEGDIKEIIVYDLFIEGFGTER